MDYVLVDITPALQAWLNGAQVNDGIALVGNSPLNATFDSKETTTQSHPQELDVVFSAAAVEELQESIRPATAGSRAAEAEGR